MYPRLYPQTRGENRRSGCTPICTPRLPESLVLTAIEVRNAKAADKPRKLFDGGGLYLHLTPDGGKRWRLKYRFDGRERLLALGTYPAIDLATARARRDEARRLLAEGTDPSAQRKTDREAARTARAQTFRVYAEEWFATHAAGWRPATRDKVRQYLDRDLLPALRDRPIAEVRRTELVALLRRIEERGAFDVVKKVRTWLFAIFAHAAVCGGIAEGQPNPAADLHLVAKRTDRQRRAHPHLTPDELPGFLAAIDGYKGDRQTAIALRLHLLTAVRPGELRHAPWSEFDLDNATWSIPAARMKMGRPHVVPLPDQAVALLRELRALNDRSELAFPSRDRRDRPISENTLNTAIARIGYGGRQTGHGFRHLVSTALNERAYNRDWIERQLAHGDDDAIRDTYNGAQYLKQRRRMMQAWADEIDRMQAGGSNVTAIRRSA